MENASRRRSRMEWLVLGAIALGALLLRLYYVHTAIVDHPIRGDAVQYYAYAWNLTHHGTFSSALPHASAVVADGFRDPGYPAFLALLAGSGDMQEAFLQRVLDMQCLLSALTVGFAAVLARRWMGFGAAVGTGLLLAIWPHLITQADYVLSETLLGFLVALALLLADCLLRVPHAWRAVATGGAFALAGLTNAVMAPFAPLVALVMLWRDPSRRHTWALVLIAALLPVAAWSLRSALLSGEHPSAGDRAKMNLVQGAWPDYHAAYAASFSDDPQAKAIMKAIDDEYAAMSADTGKGLARVAHRLGQEPGRYVAWYLSKPMELWGWNIGIGDGDIYVYPTYRSPLLMQPALSAMTGALFFLSPFVLLLAAIGVVATWVPATRAPAGLRLVAALALWVTVVYAVLQSDARYATPFRNLEVLLAVFAVYTAVKTLRKERKSAFANGPFTS